MRDLTFIRFLKKDYLHRKIQVKRFDIKVVPRNGFATYVLSYKSSFEKAVISFEALVHLYMCVNNSSLVSSMVKAF